MVNLHKAFQKSVDYNTRVAPDPLTAVLPALSVLATVASISLMNWIAEECELDRVRPKRKTSAALQNLERCCLALQGVFRRFHKAQSLFKEHDSPMKFGMHGTRVSQSAIKIYHSSIDDIASMMVVASQNSYEIMVAIEDGIINPPDDLFFGFGEVQEQINSLFLKRDTMQSAVEVGLQIAIKLTALVKQLKNYHKV
ncbi:MAG: hypothetical protein HRT83_02855 [Hyphomicrobiaceae bacterium]|nr:hypothetical protein [Hyphomicrobiaceae bacterium]